MLVSPRYSTIQSHPLDCLQGWDEILGPRSAHPGLHILGHLSNLSSQFSSLYFLFSSHRSSLLFPDMPSILPCQGIYISFPHFYLHFLNFVEALHPHFPRSLFKCPSAPCRHLPSSITALLYLDGTNYCLELCFLPIVCFYLLCVFTICFHY